MRGIGISPGLLQFLTAPVQFLIGGENVCRALVEVDAHAVTGFENRKSAIGGRFRRGVEDGRRARCAGLATIADAGQRGDAALDEVIGRAHVHHFRRARIADGSRAAHEKDALLIDGECRIVDARVIILRPVEHDGATLEGHGIVGVGKIAVPELVGDDREFHDGGIEQIAFQNPEACILLERVGEGTDHLLVSDGGIAAVLANAFAVDRQDILVDEPDRHELIDNRRHTAGMVIVLAQIFACRLEVHQERHALAIGLPVVDGQFNAQVAGDSRQVDGGVGGAAYGGVDADRIDEGFAGHHVARLDVFMNHVDDAKAGAIRHFLPVAIGRGDGCGTGQLHAERFGQRVHRGGRSHRVAIAGGRRGGGDEPHETLIVDLAGSHHLACLPDDGARTRALTPEPAIEHRAHRKRDGRDVDRGCRHE